MVFLLHLATMSTHVKSEPPPSPPNFRDEFVTPTSTSIITPDFRMPDADAHFSYNQHLSILYARAIETACVRGLCVWVCAAPVVMCLSIYLAALQNG